MSISIHVRRRIICQPCVICGIQFDIHIDHIIPLSTGGTDNESNLQSLCWQCNLRKGNRLSNEELTKLFEAQKGAHLSRAKSYKLFFGQRRLLRSVFNRKGRSEAARQRALRRWQLDREHRARLDTLDPIRVGGKIVERLIRIVNGEHVIERTFYEFDRPCDWKRKRRELLLS